MKRFTILATLISIGALTIWAFFQPMPVPATKHDNAPVSVHEATNTDMKVAPVYDATGALVSDPTGTISNAIDSVNLVVPVTGVDMKIAPVYDATGALVSDPTGTISGATESGNLVVPVTGVDMKIAPVYDATGALVSDPTGTIWSETNP